MGAQPIFSFYCDYFGKSSSTAYALRGCDCSHGFYCGFAVVNLNTSFSSSSWTVALPYHLNKATSTSYAIRGGSSGLGFDCGIFYVRLTTSSGATGWGFGASLSFKQKNKGLDYYPILYLCF